MSPEVGKISTIYKRRLNGNMPNSWLRINENITQEYIYAIFTYVFYYFNKIPRSFIANDTVILRSL